MEGKGEGEGGVVAECGDGSNHGGPHPIRTEAEADNDAKFYPAHQGEDQPRGTQPVPTQAGSQVMAVQVRAGMGDQG